MKTFMRGQNKKAAPKNRDGLSSFNPGSDLRSRAVTSAVSSALRGLTSVFGMGTGVTPAVRPPGNLLGHETKSSHARISNFQIGNLKRQPKEVGDANLFE